MHCINNDSRYTAASINLIANKAINFANLKINSCAYKSVPEVFKKLNEELEKTGKINETVVTLV